MLVSLSREDAYHLSKVLKKEVGDVIEIFCSTSFRTFEARLSKISRSEAYAIIENEFERNHIAPVTTVIGLVKPSVCDEIVEKLVEAGALEIRFFLADYSQEKLTQAVIESRIERFEKIKTSALKQSKSSVATRITVSQSLKFALEDLHKDKKSKENEFRGVCCIPNQRQVPTLTTLFSSKFRQNSSLENSPNCDDSSLIIGPEGGLSLEEIDLALSYDYAPVSLGPTVLRTQTAAVVGVATLHMLLQPNNC